MKRPLAIIATVVFLICYFLPFFTYQGTTISLWTILTTALQYGKFAVDILLFDLAFIAAILGLIMVILNKGTKTRAVMGAGIMGLIGCALELFLGGAQESLQSLGMSVLEILGIAFWLLVIASIAMIVSHLLKEPESAPPVPPIAPPPQI